MLNHNHVKCKRFGQWLIEHRNQQCWTQYELAAKLNVSRNSVHRWEIGEVMPSKANLQKIAELFGVTVQEIFMAIEQRKRTEAENEPGTLRAAEQNPAYMMQEGSRKALEAENSLLRAENMTLRERVQKLTAAMKQMIE